MAANSQPTLATSRKRGCSLLDVHTSRRESAAFELSFPIPFQRGIGNGSFAYESLYAALYVQGILQNASGLNPGIHIALYVQGFGLITPSLVWNRHFALYVQGGIEDVSGLGKSNQVALYVQGFGIITSSLEWTQDFALYVQGGIQDHSFAGRTPSFNQSRLKPTHLLKCSICPSNRLQPGWLCRTPFPLNNELNPAMRGSAHLGTRFFWRNRMT